MMRFLLEDTQGAWYASALRGLMGIRRMRTLGWRRPGGRFRSKLRHGGLADEGPALHAPVILCRRERVCAGDLAEGGSFVEARCAGASDREGIEPHPRADPTCMRPAIAERHGDHAIGHSREEPHRELERAAATLEADQVLVRKAERFGRLRADERG